MIDRDQLRDFAITLLLTPIIAAVLLSLCTAGSPQP